MVTQGSELFDHMREVAARQITSNNLPAPFNSTMTISDKSCFQIQYAYNPFTQHINGNMNICTQHLGSVFGEGLANTGVAPCPIPELIPDPIALGVRMGGRVGVRVGVIQRGVRGVLGVATDPEPGETSVV